MVELKLGDKAKDKITGYEGYIDSIHHYLHGCTRYAIALLGMDRDGKVSSPLMFDKPRVEAMSGNVLDLAPQGNSPPGGPRDAALESRETVPE